MNISNVTRRAYSEVDEFLGLLTEDKRNKIPEEIRELFKEEKDKEYLKNITADIDIEKQELMEETLAIIAMLNLKYWCEDKNERERLKQIYRNNEKEYQELVQVGFDESIFEKNLYRQRNMELPKKEIIVYHENLFKKGINKILKMLHIKK